MIHISYFSLPIIFKLSQFFFRYWIWSLLTRQMRYKTKMRKLNHKYSLVQKQLTFFRFEFESFFFCSSIRFFFNKYLNSHICRRKRIERLSELTSSELTSIDVIQFLKWQRQGSFFWAELTLFHFWYPWTLIQFTLIRDTVSKWKKKN